MPDAKPYALVATLLLVSCGGERATGPRVASIVVEPASALIVGVGEAESFVATVRDGSGATVAGATVFWSVEDSEVARVDTSGTAVAAGAGVTTVTATADGVSDEARLEVWVPDVGVVYQPDSTYSGRQDYIEYTPGELPLVISVGHGGDREPAEIPDRTYGTLVTDLNTIQTAEAVRDALVAATGYAPHLVVSHLRRTKLDPNREIEEAAQGNPFAELAWEEYHGFIEEARQAVVEARDAGLYLDVHGHGHAIPRVEIGYLLTAADLDQDDSFLDQPATIEKTSIRELGSAQRIPFSELVRGSTSLGGYLEAEGVPAVPSPANPTPATDPYFSGGYSTRRHGSREAGELVSGIQLELHRPGIRDTEENRRAFALVLARVVEAYMLEHIGHFRPEGAPAR